jgi:hypothetical protein
MNETLVNNTVSNILCSQIEETFKSGARFISITYTNQNGETSKYTLLTGVILKSLYLSDLRSLEKLRNHLDGIKLIACNELIASIKNSLEKGIGKNDRYTLKGYFTPITANGEVSYHVSDEGVKSLYLRGYSLSKTVLVKGTYPVVKSSEKTLAKQEIEKSLKRGKIRTFKIDMNQIHGVRLNGMTVEIS